MALLILSRAIIASDCVLVGWHTKPVDLIISYSPGIVGYPITAVALYGIDITAFDLFYDANMVRDTVLTVGFGLVPIEVDDVAGVRGIAAVLPLIAGSEPAFARDTACGFRDKIGVDIATLVSTPGNLSLIHI